MTDLKQKLLKALALPPAHEHTSMTVYAGHEFENARLKPVHDALVECADALDAMIKAAADKNCGLRVADEALAKLKSLVDA